MKGACYDAVLIIFRIYCFFFFLRVTRICSGIDGAMDSPGVMLYYCVSNQIKCVIIWYRSIALSNYKGDVIARAICHLRSILVVWYIGTPSGLLQVILAAFLIALISLHCVMSTTLHYLTVGMSIPASFFLFASMWMSKR